ncbi:hypothetical protein BDN67DRAFT_488826 [Paxillus ammoniavirescens]|nr:hypothetical protein BDN67DRAFT_488826 [Paxillus ammoniavirescens]
MPSLTTVTTLPPSLTNPRKRTSSFFEPAPRKASRMTLRRTESFLSLSDCNDENQTESGSFLYLTSSPSHHVVPYNRSLLHYKEQRERNKLGRNRTEFTIAPAHPNAPLPKRATRVPPPKPQPALSSSRTTSPLAPTQKLLSPRPIFPRSKREPDLYRVALKARMRSSPEGEKMLRMGPRLAIAILSATKELEKIVSAHADDDVVMTDDMDCNSWGIGFGRDMVVTCSA